MRDIGISPLAPTLSFLGGLSARLDLLKAKLVLSMLGAATGVCLPIGLTCFFISGSDMMRTNLRISQYIYMELTALGAVETFIIGAALSATSLGKYEPIHYFEDLFGFVFILARYDICGDFFCF